VAFIETTPREQAQGAVEAMYQEIEKRVGYFPNWVQAFSPRPGVWEGWDRLVSAIRGNMSVRMYELATLAAARALRSTYCSLAHGTVLAEKVSDATAVAAIMDDSDQAPITPAERAMMRFAERVVREADRITASEIDGLHAHGFSDAEIFDMAAAASARCFFAKLLDALGVQADARFSGLDATLLQSLTVGRPVAT
jgi:uncharacterized peroxidase-related enzyme